VWLSQDRREHFGLTDILEAAYDVFLKVIEVKQPDVILNLQFQTSRTKNALARKLSSQIQRNPQFSLELVEVNFVISRLPVFVSFSVLPKWLLDWTTLSVAATLTITSCLWTSILSSG
jgi:hypothetical protein